MKTDIEARYDNSVHLSNVTTDYILYKRYNISESLPFKKNELLSGLVKAITDNIKLNGKTGNRTEYPNIYGEKVMIDE